MGPNVEPVDDEGGGPPGQAFYSVGEAARLFGMSEMTLYRAIHAGEFPAVRIRDRLLVPVRAIDAMVDAAIRGGLVSPTAWRPSSAEPTGDASQHPGPKQMDRPRPGANQTGAGSPSTHAGAQEVSS